jgi:hypothetical protein
MATKTIIANQCGQVQPSQKPQKSQTPIYARDFRFVGEKDAPRTQFPGQAG